MRMWCSDQPSVLMELKVSRSPDAESGCWTKTVFLEGIHGSAMCHPASRLTWLPCSCPADLKLHLQSTDYGSFLANEASPLTVSVIDDKLKEKMVVEFRHMRNQSYEPLASFMDFITYVKQTHEDCGWRIPESREEISSFQLSAFIKDAKVTDVLIYVASDCCIPMRDWICMFYMCYYEGGAIQNVFSSLK